LGGGGGEKYTCVFVENTRRRGRVRGRGGGGWQDMIKMDIKRNKTGLLMVRRGTMEGSGRQGSEP
jgi:hypothetical protein